MQRIDTVADLRVRSPTVRKGITPYQSNRGKSSPCSYITYSTAAAICSSLQRYLVLPCLDHTFVSESINPDAFNFRVAYDLNAFNNFSGVSAAETTTCTWLLRTFSVYKAHLRKVQTSLTAKATISRCCALSEKGWFFNRANSSFRSVSLAPIFGAPKRLNLWRSIEPRSSPWSQVP